MGVTLPPNISERRIVDEWQARHGPSPAVPPAGATEICKGDLTLNGAKVAVSAFRLA